MAAAVLPQTPRVIRGQQSGGMRGPRSDDGGSSHRLGYFDKYPARATPPGKVADNTSEPCTPSAPASLNGHGPPPLRARAQRSGSIGQDLHIHTEPAKYEWPSKPDHPATPSRSSSPDSPSPKPSKPPSVSSKSRTRNSVASTIPELRYSASTLDRSSFSSPQTPVGAYHPLYSGDNVVVAAPVHGVEMMDALVDGLNGSLAEHSSSDGNDYRMISRSRRHAVKKRLTSLEKRHPGLYPHSTPPLPKPPHGIQLGTPSRSVLDATVMDESIDEPTVPRTPRSTRPRVRSSTNADTPPFPSRSSTDPIIRKGRSSGQLRKTKTSITSPETPNPTIDQIIKDMAVRKGDKALSNSGRPSVVPSISEIIRTHAPELAKAKLNRPVRNGPSPVLPTSLEETEQDDEPGGRSSVDSITHEVQATLQKTQSSSLHHARSFPNQFSSTASAPPATYGGLRSLRVSESEQDSPLEAPKYARSVYSASSHGFDNPSSFFSSVFFSPPPADSAMAIAQYLRSPRLTRLLTLRKPPHRGLTVSLADVGNPNGRPVMVFLGLGCVRYLVALYDEMAEALGLRLIAVDRWGMGRTNEVPREQRGLKEWAAVCEEVMDTLAIKSCGILAHSAGAPYALAFALRVSHRITGSIHLLAPWVGGGIDAAGYKWLKYVPNSMIKAAQSAEWKVHGWKLGKPPTIVYEGIGFDPKASVTVNATPPKSESPEYTPLTADALRDIENIPSSTAQSATQPAQPSTPQNGGKEEAGLTVPKPSIGTLPRTSMGGWSDYDDLADFEGKFDSQTTLPTTPPVPPLPKNAQNMPTTKRKASNRFFGKLKTPALPSNPSPVSNSTSTDSSKGSQKIRVLPSISSLKGKLTGQRNNPNSHKPSTPRLEANLDSFGTGLGIDVDFKPSPGERAGGIEAWVSSTQISDSRPTSPVAMSTESQTFPRTRRSVSLTASVAPTLRSLPAPVTPVLRTNSSPANPRPLSGDGIITSGMLQNSFTTPPRAVATTSAPTSSVATALLRASHKEAQKGLTNDLLSILERDAKPWGFSYADVRQKVKVWYGDKDEKISESGIRWMERVMKDCEVKICKGKDHSLMTCAAVVVDALESLQADLRQS